LMQNIFKILTYYGPKQLSYKSGNEEININTCNFLSTVSSHLRINISLEHDNIYKFISCISHLLVLYFGAMKRNKICLND
ncbi:MAG: hypothetical protein PWK00_09505, partial [Coxiella burnetii]|nr:hypothetical protein [Coxiella burnetii]